MPLRTEYQLHYGASKEEDEKENYSTRLSFRKDRMLSEKRHTPLIWIDLEDDSVANKIVDIDIHNDVTITDESPIEALDNVVVVSVDDKTSANDNKKIVEEIVPQQIYSTEDTVTKLQIKCKSKDDKRKAVLKPVNRKSVIEHDKPIIAYGWADNTSLHAKKTFNIKAPKTEVRISALRAATHRDVQRKKRLTIKEKIEKEKLKQQDIIDTLTNFNQWETEYKRQFGLR